MFLARGINIRMILLSEFTECCFNFCRRGEIWQAEYVIIILQGLICKGKAKSAALKTNSQIQQQVP